MIKLHPKTPLIILLIVSLSLNILFLWQRTFRQQKAPSYSEIISVNITSTSKQNSYDGPVVVLEFPPPTPSPEEIITERMERIASLCAAKNYPNFKNHHMFYFPELGVTWLPVYKSSSTTWKEFLIDTVLGPNVAHNGNHYSYKVLGSYKLRQGDKQSGRRRKRTWKKEPRSSIRFTVIRHPLARLVSHYRNKSIGPGSTSLGNDIWVKPAMIFARQKKSWSPNRQAKFAKEYDNQIHHNLKNPSPGNPYLKSFLTFPELVRFILHGQNRPPPNYLYMNAHWIPGTQRIDVCQNDLDIIVKLENEAVELPYLLERLNLTQYHHLLSKKENASAGEKVVAVDQVVEHMKLLTKEEQRQLNEMYALDYEMFGYEPVYV